MGQTYLIDTNIAIYILNNTLKPEDHPDLQAAALLSYNLSIITKIELLGWKASASEERQLESFINEANVIDLTDEVVDTTIQIRREHKIPLPDAIIAATALTYDWTLLTRNEKDFNRISGIKLVNPMPGTP